MRPVLVLTLLVAAGCGGDNAADTTAPAPPSSEPAVSSSAPPETAPETTPETSPETTPETSPETAPETTPETISGELACEPVGGAHEGGDPDSFANVVAAIDYFVEGTCERFLVQFGFGSAVDGMEPAQAPEFTVVDQPGGLPVLQISIPAVQEAAQAEFLVGAEEADPATAGIYVVRTLDGNANLFVLLRKPVAWEVVRDSEGLVISFSAIGEPYPTVPGQSEHVVVLAPRPGDPPANPVPVFGWARSFEANVIIRAGDVQTFTTAADWTQMWGYFSIDVEFPAAGTYDVEVGEDSPASGEFSGVVVPGVEVSAP